ncbi:MAG: hypothetical protein LUC18_01875, partial [Porphyromonadaceae bacterium]|nr:hypothetical protein [Porphyromonadaceae bacterium]
MKKHLFPITLLLLTAATLTTQRTVAQTQTQPQAQQMQPIAGHTQPRPQAQTVQMQPLTPALPTAAADTLPA